jgi:hypothetical protein
MFLFIVELVASSHFIYSDKNQIIIHSCLSQNISVEIPSTIIEIESNSFSNITTQMIPFNEFSILKVLRAFSFASSTIQKIILSSSVNVIEKFVFAFYRNLQFVEINYIPESLFLVAQV